MARRRGQNGPWHTYQSHLPLATAIVLSRFRDISHDDRVDVDVDVDVDVVTVADT